MEWFVGFLVTFFIAPFVVMDAIYKGCKRMSFVAKESKIKSANVKRMKPWLEVVTDEKMENDVFSRITVSERADVVSEALETLERELPEDVNRDFPKTSYLYLADIYIANRGKLRKAVAQKGIKCAWYFTIKDMQLKSIAEYVLWLDKKLREHGVEERLVQDFNHCTSNSNKKIYHISTIEEALDVASVRRNGTYIWEPMVSDEYKENIVEPLTTNS